MIIALLFLILFAILFPKALKFLLAMMLIGGIVILGEAHAASAAADDFPVRDVESACRKTDSYFPGSSSSYNGCMDLAQSTYDYDKVLWSSTSLEDRATCISVSNSHNSESPNDGVAFYMYLRGCLELKAAEYDARRPRHFNPW
jgi:hypothetical protein